MTNYVHLKSQMIHLLELLRSILYPNVFDELEEAHTPADLEAMARQQLLEVLRRVYQEPPEYEEVADALFAKLEERWKAYRKQSKTTLLDASEGEAAGNKKSRRHFPDAERWLYRVLRVYTFA